MTSFRPALRNTNTIGFRWVPDARWAGWVTFAILDGLLLGLNYGYGTKYRVQLGQSTISIESIHPFVLMASHRYRSTSKAVCQWNLPQLN